MYCLRMAASIVVHMKANIAKAAVIHAASTIGVPRGRESM
jgi:hypothetical protein